MKIKVLHIGPVPPPVGGVSVHITRLTHRIIATDDLDCFVFDIGRFKFFDRYLKSSNLIAAIVFFLKCDIMHLHISNKWKVIIARIAKVFGKKVIYTRHNVRDAGSEIEKKLHALSDRVILVSSVSSDIPDGKTFIIPAYISAINTKSLNDELVTRLKGFNCVIAAISSHPSNQPALFNGKDIYGFDLLLKAYENSSSQNQVLLLLDPMGTMESIYRPEVDLLNKMGKAVIYLTDDIDFSSLTEFLSAYIRPTITDGDSIAIREALNAGVKVIASDCVERPKGVHLFKSGDIASLTSVLENVNPAPNVTRDGQPDFAKKVLDLYRGLKNHA